MNCRGSFVFRDFRKVDAGKFVNASGETIEYAERYNLKVDEITNKGIQERIFKVATDNTNVLNSVKNLQPYDKVIIDFDVQVYNTRVSLVPLAIEPVKK